jgi:hypothetical protein
VGKEEINEAVVTCYHRSCTAIQRGRPVRMCLACHEKHHSGVQDDRHVFQVGPLNPWYSGLKRMNLHEVYAAKSLLQALSRLLESVPQVSVYNNRQHKSSQNVIDREYVFTYSKDALFMLSHFCTPTKHVTEGRKYWLTRFVAYSFEWLFTLHQMVEELSCEDPTFPLKHLYKHHLWKDVMKWMVPWLQAIHKLSPQVFVNCLVPNLVPGAQVKEYRTELDQYQHTLQVLHTLSWNKLKLFHDSNAYNELFCTVMLEWMEELSSSTYRGKMDPLQEVFQTIFNTIQSIEELASLLRFLEVKLNGEEIHSHYKLLEWVQDLTHLGVVIPFLKQYFEKVMYSLENPEKETEEVGGGGRRGVRSHMDRGVEPLGPNAPTTKCILMLDIILAQLQLRPDKMVYAHSVLFTLPCDDVSALMLSMLKLPGVWSDGHTSDHHDTSNPCALCRAHEMWFDIASQILQEYNEESQKREPKKSDKEASPNGTQAGSQASSTFKRLKVKLAAISAFKGPLAAAISETTTVQEAVVDKSGHVSYSSTLVPSDPPPLPSSHSGRLRAISEEIDTNSPGSPGTPGTPRVFGGAQGPLGGSWGPSTGQGAGSNTPPISRNMLQRQLSVYDPSVLYKLFQKAVQKLEADNVTSQASHDHQPVSKLHPQALYYIVDFLETFVFTFNIFEVREASKTDMLNDSRKLFFVLWDQLCSEQVLLAQKVTPLLLRCVEFMHPTLTQAVDPPKDKPFLVFWDKINTRCFKNSDWTAKFHAAEKVVLLSQFVKDFTDLCFPQYAFLANIFCCLIEMIADPKPEVSVRARYCIEAAKKSSLQGLVLCMTELFNFMPSQQSRVLKCLSSLHSTFPSLGLVNYDDVIRSFFVYQRLWGEHKSASASPHIPPRARVSRVAAEEHGGGFGDKQLREDQRVLSHSAKILTEIFVLIFELLSEPSVGKFSSHVSSEDLIGKIEQMLYYGKGFSVKVDELRSSELLELFLSKVYKILDRNTSFCGDCKLIYVVLKLLVFVALPSESEFLTTMDHLELSRQCVVSAGLELLDEQLCQSWLQVYFMICYKYGGVVQDIDTSDADILTGWIETCARIVINTVHTKPHVCSMQRESPPKEIPAPLSASTTPRETRSSSLFGEKLHGISKPRLNTRQPSVVSSLSSSLDTNRSKKHRPSEVADRANEEANIFRVRAVSIIKRPNFSVDKCLECDALKKAYSENIVNLCVVAMGTFAHRFPKVVAPYIKDIVIGMAKVIITGSYSWQDVKTAQSKPGSAIPVAKQFLNCVLSQFGGRNLFLHLFKWDLKDNPLLPAMVLSLPPAKEAVVDSGRVVSETMTQATPVECLLKVSSNLQGLLREEKTLENLGTYLSLLKGPAVKKEIVSLLPQLEQFLKKLLKSQNQETITCDNNWNMLIRIVSQFIHFSKEVGEEQLRVTSQEQRSSEDSLAALSSLVPSLTFILELGLTRCPKVSLNSLLVLATAWYDVFSLEQKSKEQERFLRLIGIYHLTQALQLDSTYHMNSRIALLQFANVIQGGSHGYVMDFAGQKVNVRELMADCVYKYCSEAFTQFTINLDSGIHLLCTLRFKEPVLQLLTAELLLKHLDSYSSHSPVQTIRALLRPVERATPEASSRGGITGVGGRGVTPANILSMLSWLILASMRSQAVVNAMTVHDPSATSTTVIQHTSMLVLRLLEHSHPDHFVKEVQKIVMDALSSLAMSNAEAQAIFTFLQVWTVYLELVQDQLIIDVVSYLIGLWESIASKVQEASDGGSTAYHFHKCISILKKANVTVLPSLFYVIVEEKVASLPGPTACESSEKLIGSLNDWISDILQDLNKQTGEI